MRLCVNLFELIIYEQNQLLRSHRIFRKEQYSFQIFGKYNYQSKCNQKTNIFKRKRQIDIIKKVQQRIIMDSKINTSLKYLSLAYYLNVTLDIYLSVKTYQTSEKFLSLIIAVHFLIEKLTIWARVSTQYTIFFFDFIQLGTIPLLMRQIPKDLNQLIMIKLLQFMIPISFYQSMFLFNATINNNQSNLENYLIFLNFLLKLFLISIMYKSENFDGKFGYFIRMTAFISNFTFYTCLFSITDFFGINLFLYSWILILIFILVRFKLGYYSNICQIIGDYIYMIPLERKDLNSIGNQRYFYLEVYIMTLIRLILILIFGSKEVFQTLNNYQNASIISQLQTITIIIGLISSCLFFISSRHQIYEYIYKVKVFKICTQKQLIQACNKLKQILENQNINEFSFDIDVKYTFRHKNIVRFPHLNTKCDSESCEACAKLISSLISLPSICPITFRLREHMLCPFRYSLLLIHNNIDNFKLIPNLEFFFLDQIYIQNILIQRLLNGNYLNQLTCIMINNITDLRKQIEFKNLQTTLIHFISFHKLIRNEMLISPPLVMYDLLCD